MPHQVIFIVGDYLPVSSNTSFRAAGLIEELSADRWQSVVLTRVPPSGAVEFEPADEASRFGYKVVRTAYSPGAYRLAKKIPLFRHVAAFPDRQSVWIPSAIAQGARLIRRVRPKVLFASCQPYSALIVGTSLARIFGLPLVCEFRDPVLELPRRRRTASARRIALVRRTVRLSTFVCAINQSIARELSSFASPDGPAPCIIPHGYRTSDYGEWATPKIQDHFTLLFAGSLYNHPALEVFCEAIARACSADAEFRQVLRILIVGHSKDGAYDVIRQHAQRLGLHGLFAFHGWQQQAHLRKLVAECHAQLCFDFDDFSVGNVSTAKLPKLIAYGRPILAIAVPNGEAWRTVVETQTGLAVDHENAEAVADAMLHIFRCARQGNPPTIRREQMIGSYSFRCHASVLSDLFDAACQKWQR